MRRFVVLEGPCYEALRHIGQPTTQGAPPFHSFNDTPFYNMVCTDRDSVLEPSLNSSYHLRVCPFGNGFNGGDCALSELRTESLCKRRSNHIVRMKDV
jgi:hypothetical protein